jgi:hypothetical protein
MLPSARVRAACAALLPALLLVVVAIAEIVVAARAPARVPGDDDWARAAEVVRQRRQAGELIVFAPDWIDPVGRLHLGDLISIAEAARMDADRFAAIWELSIRGARAPETAGLRPTWQARHGGVTVRRYARPPVRVVADLVGLASRIRASGPRGRGPVVELAEVGFAPRRCVLVVPAPGQSVTLDYGRVPLGRTLVGYVGLADVFTRRDVREPGHLAVRIGGRVVAEVTAGVDDGWRRFEAATTPGEHPLEIVVSAVGPRARDRRICFAAEARR